MITIRRESPIIQSARVLQTLGMFDVPPADRSVLEWTPRLPLAEKPWSIGLIVGPSGAGKSTIARELFGDALRTGFDWPCDRAILDAFPAGMSIKDITGYLTAVGFGSPPAWLRPFPVLSTGEQFRVTMARALAESVELVVIDEFTSVVDRQVAKVASSTVAKAVRRLGRQFVAVSCHEDILEWLQPDWVYQPAGDVFEWRCLQRRPSLDLAVHAIDRTAWPVFAPYHYLSRDLAKGAQCFGAFLEDRCVAFTAYTHFPHPRTRNIKMGHRLVVLPDYQGLGIAGRLDDWLGQSLYERGYRYHNCVAHPAMLAFYGKSPRWRLERTGRLGRGTTSSAKSLRAHQQSFSNQRISSTFVYVPPQEAPCAAS
jgi:GNAT superfamily N-acetyltransferase